jgi:hypothetical protein
MIHIDFQGGAHGNFLEFICNVMAGVETNGDPFNTNGASHIKKYRSPKVFFCGHYSFKKIPLLHDRVIAITIDIDDLLPLSQISLLRAGDYGHDNNELEINTYNKLNNVDYRWVLDTILDSFFVNQIENSYNAVRDPSWPNIYNLADFQNLPEHIRKECTEIHELNLLELNENHPDCPRYILREFFQLGFEDPNNHGFITQQKLMKYNDQVSVYNFPMSAFYNTTKFMEHIESIASWANMPYTNQHQIKELHIKFLEKQPYKDSKIKCDRIAQELINGLIVPPDLNLIEEAYVNSILRKNGHECRY